MELKRISDLFWKVSPNSFFLSIVLGVVTGLSYSLLIPFLMYSLGTDVESNINLDDQHFSYFNSPTAGLATKFLWACVLIVLTKGISTILSTYLANKASVEHRLWLYRRIQNLKLADLERVGQARLINILNIDIPAITGAATVLPQIWISIITVIGMLGYLVYLNAKIFVFVVGCLAVAIVVYQVPLIFATIFFKQSRDSYDRVQQGVIGLIYGAKELKLNRFKSDEYYKYELLGPELVSLNQNLKGSSTLIFAQSYGEIISFLVISVVVFHLRYVFSLSDSNLLGISMALLYLAGPVGVILGGMAGIRHGKVSMSKLDALYTELEEETKTDQSVVNYYWDRMIIRNLSYIYSSVAEQFMLQNINLQFDRGQISFIVGGNGSGKSTLGKCLSLHYIPTEGEICLGNVVINSENIESSRKQISAVFSDYYLFKKLYSEADSKTKENISIYLKYLELDGKVSVIGDEFTTTDLSDGQKKRLALLVLLLENRDICIFDEWAADQDPRFKNIFYSVILRDLKMKNKVIIVITHDDRYFSCADQIISIEDGKLANVTLNN